MYADKVKNSHRTAQRLCRKGMVKAQISRKVLINLRPSSQKASIEGRKERFESVKFEVGRKESNAPKAKVWRSKSRLCGIGKTLNSGKKKTSKNFNVMFSTVRRRPETARGSTNKI